MGRLLTLYSGGFSPAQLKNKMWWLDANDLSTITKSSNLVSSWADKSGNGNHATEATNKPLYVAGAVNGRGAIKFYDGASATLLNISDHASMDWSTMHIYTVLQRHTDLGGNETYMIKGNASPNLEMELRVRNTPDSAVVILNGGTGFAASANDLGHTLSLSTPYLHEGVYDGAAIYTFLNNQTPSPASTSYAGPPFNGSGAVVLGQFGAGAQPYGGYICEMVAFNVAHAGATRTKMQNYLAKKWGIALS